MEIVIEISDELKKALDNNEEYRLYTESVGHIILTAIKNGIPLPKHHGRLIDVSKFVEKVVHYSHQSTKTIGQALDETPTIIPATEEGE